MSEHTCGPCVACRDEDAAAEAKLAEAERFQRNASAAVVIAKERIAELERDLEAARRVPAGELLRARIEALGKALREIKRAQTILAAWRLAHAALTADQEAHNG